MLNNPSRRGERRAPGAGRTASSASIQPRTGERGGFAPTQIILITGCSSGIGLTTAQILHQRGHQVFAGVRKEEDIERLKQLGLNPVQLDVDDPTSIQSALKIVLSQTNNRLDVLINNAGYGQMGALEDLSREVLRAQFETNVFGLQELTNAVIPIMRQQKQGRIINISSLLGIISLTYRGAYCASKYAVESLSDTLRLELKKYRYQSDLDRARPHHQASFRDTARTLFAHRHIDPGTQRPSTADLHRT